MHFSEQLQKFIYKKISQLGKELYSLLLEIEIIVRCIVMQRFSAIIQSGQDKGVTIWQRARSKRKAAFSYNKNSSQHSTMGLLLNSLSCDQDFLTANKNPASLEDPLAMNICNKKMTFLLFPTVPSICHFLKTFFLV